MARTTADLFDVWRARHHLLDVPKYSPVDDERTEVSIDLTHVMLDELGFTHDEFDDARMSNLRALVQSLVEVLEFGS